MWWWPATFPVFRKVNGTDLAVHCGMALQKWFILGALFLLLANQNGLAATSKTTSNRRCSFALNNHRIAQTFDISELTDANIEDLEFLIGLDFTSVDLRSSLGLDLSLGPELAADKFLQLNLLSLDHYPYKDLFRNRILRIANVMRRHATVIQNARGANYRL